MSEILAVGDLRLTVSRSSRRKTLQITVERDGLLTAAIPDECSMERLRAFVQSKKGWIYQKLALKAQQAGKTGPQTFAAGQGVHYLGRSHRIALVAGDAPLALRNGRFQLARRDQGRARELFQGWLVEHGKRWLQSRLGIYASKFAVSPTGLIVADLGNRWGSCSSRGTINIHWKAVQLPPSAIDYLLCHELAHLQEPHHTPEFWRVVGRALPDYADRKEWLARHGAPYSL
jgi:predicted metal-dependent hydrolase